MTLEQLYRANPDWRDLEIAVYKSDGSLDYVDAEDFFSAGRVYESEDEGKRILVFSSN